MDYLISASQGAIRSLPGKIESLLLEPENGLRKGEKDALGLLKSDLREIIDSYLMEPSEVETPAFTANCWVKEVRELSYDIDDFVDMLVHDDADARIVARLRKKLNPRRRGITNEISGFRTRVKEAIQRYRSYNLDKLTFRPRYVSDEHRIRPLYGEGAAGDLVDIDIPMNKLEEWLNGDVEQNPRVVSIVGFGGVGKTTLAKELYYKFGGRFECRAFVRTSRKPDVRKLLTSILSQLRVHLPPDARAWGVDELIKKISTHLQSKRYFIIVDDIWTASIWDIVSGALPEGSFCSRILTTTEIEAVAQTCCGYNPKYILKMEPLSDDASRKLFCSRVFGHQHERSKQLTETSYEIARKCGGFPLAIITTASLLASHLDRLEQCNYIKNSLSSNLRTDPTLEGMTQVLNVSYNNLPQHLRACMLYFSIYQEDYIIWKDDLVKQWIAEGFISAIEGKDMEEVAMSYFGELVNRGLIQPVDVNYNDEILSCTVHYMVLDLIQDKCVEENFVTTIDHSHTTVRHADKIRRLSLHFGNEEDVTPPTSLRLSQVRSLAYFGLSNCMPSITGFKLLRVLTLHLWGHQDNMILDLNTINKLFRLRYLEIACNVTLEIQTKMQGLHYLETMKIDARVSVVEADIVNLPGLLHLTLPSEINQPIGIDHMALLRTLGRFNLSSNSEGNVESLGKLTNLRNLHLTCSAASSDNLDKNMKCLGSVLEKLSNLTSITLVPAGSSRVTLDYAGASGTSISHDGLNSISARLERLELSRRICTFSSLHGWIGKLDKLCILKTAVRELLRNDIDILKGLPALTALSLYVETAPVERIVFDKEGFSVLKYFKFKCRVPWLKFEADAMPNLRKLMLGFNALGADQHGTATISIEHLPGLKEISAKIGGAGSDADSALAIAVSSHPRNPRVNVQGTLEKQYGTLEEQDDILQKDPDKHYGTQDGESGEDENKQAGSMVREEQGHGTLVDQDEIMEDPDEDSGEEENKQTGRRISTLPESSSHLPVPELKKAESKPGKAMAIVSASQGAMGSLLGKLGDLLTDKYKLLKEAKGEIMFLKAELESMHAFLMKMLDVEKPNEQAKYWAKLVRELSYDIEDSVDEFMLRVEPESNSNIARGLKSRVVEVSERRPRYKNDDAVSKPNNTPIDPRMLAMYAETVGPVGIEEPREELIRLMMDEEGVPSQQLKVLSIVGFGGLGKTTLANEIYRKLEGQFQCRSFVSVSQKPNVRKILRNILSQVGYVAQEQTNMEIWDDNELSSTLQKFLTDKRYIIVIDDIWDANAWDIIRHALPQNKNGSRVITTTRIESVAAMCCSNHYEHVYKMRPLSNEESRRLFFLRIFGSEGACPPYLKEVSAEILKKCGGLPLAIITISSLLANRGNKLKEHWEHVRNSLRFNLEMNPTLDGMRQILSLSYIRLPDYLKTCMLYFGIYPEDYTIDKYDLVRQWVAQGFISKELGRDPEDVAEGYFNELVNRSIIQPVRTDPNDVVLSCRVHDMMLDLIVHKCREENFITTIDDIQDITGLHDKVRRLSLYLDGVIDGTALGTVQLSQVRALARFGTSTYIPPLLEFKHLRVLTLEFPSRNSEQVIIDLTEMCHLFQLRYLKIVAHGKIALPSKIRGLQQLETLEIGGYMVEVPSDVVHLRRLLHLIVPGGISLPDGIGNMKSLRTLQTLSFYKNSIDTIRDIRDLTNLRDLKINILYDLEQLDDIARQHVNVLCSSLEKLCNLKYLCIHCFAWCDEWSSLPICSRLQRLDFGNVSRVPKWISKLHNLYNLKLDVNEVREDDVGILAQLPSLTGLHLHILRTPKETMVICGTGFPVLKHFKINCARIAYLTFEAGAMPRLQRLKMRFNAEGWDKYGAAPAGIEHLSGLKEISVRIGAYGIEESDGRALQSALRNAIDMHPGRPTANIECQHNMEFGFGF